MQKFKVDDVVKVSGGIKSRHDKDPNGKIESVDPDGTYTVEIWGIVGPGDDMLLKGVPEHTITLLQT